MRKWLLVLLTLAASLPLHAQGNAVALTGTGAPAGGCAFVMIYINKSDNTFYDCNNGTWHLVGPGAAGAATWNSLSNPTGNQALTMAHFTSAWTYDATTGLNVNLFAITDTLNNTGTGHLMLVNTASGSAAKPIGFFAGGTSNGVEMDTTGKLGVIGTGNINATQYKGGNASGTGSCTNQVVTATNDAAAPTCSTVANAMLANTSTTVSGQTCTLGGTCTITRECSDGIGDGLNAIPAGTYLATNCFNDFGATYTITAIRCFTDNNGTSTLNAANDAATGLLTGAVTCTNAFASGTQSGTTTRATSHWINFTFVADGATKRATFEVTVTR